ncbi:folylpolyglutamate synthase [Anaerotruncus sp. CAG:390]|nr:folylpolyglutamate synthase [Anaerotruncus sp. CAG:390]
MIVLGTGDLGAAETAAAGDLDSAGTESHRVADRHLHSTAERDTAFKLTGNVLCNELGVEVGAADLNNVEGHRDLLAALVLADDLFNLRLEDFDILTAATDHKTRLCAVDINFDFVLIAFDLDLRDARLLEFALEELTDLVVGHENVSENLVLYAPSRIPVLDNAHTKAVRINFLSHYALTSLVSLSLTARVTCDVLLRILSPEPLALGIILLRVGPGHTKHSET